jgi:toxin CcdB
VVVIQSDLLDALAHYAAPLPARLLRRPVDNLATQASVLVSALDAVLSGV